MKWILWFSSSSPCNSIFSEHRSIHKITLFELCQKLQLHKGLEEKAKDFFLQAYVLGFLQTMTFLCLIRAIRLYSTLYETSERNRLPMFLPSNPAHANLLAFHQKWSIASISPLTQPYCTLKNTNLVELKGSINFQFLPSLTIVRIYLPQRCSPID